MKKNNWIKVEFCYNGNSINSFDYLCTKYNVKYKKDPNYSQTFHGCDAPDVGYLMESIPEGFVENAREMHIDNFIVHNECSCSCCNPMRETKNEILEGIEEEMYYLRDVLHNDEMPIKDKVSQLASSMFTCLQEIRGIINQIM